MTEEMQGGPSHWERVYAERRDDELSWFQREAAMSLEMIRAAAVPKDAPVVDVGGGSSRLMDGLLDEGFLAPAVLDISANALARARERLGTRGERVRWIVEDVTAWRPERVYSLWHDRAVLHFLTEERAREGYLAAVEAGVAPGGVLVVATFAPDGPETCSGLPVRRYAPGDLASLFGPDWRLEFQTRQRHETPGGRIQPFTWCRFRRQ